MTPSIAVVRRESEPLSIRMYRQRITAGLRAAGLMVSDVAMDGSPPPCEILWDPGMAGAQPPARCLRRSHAPVVVTVHGVRPYVLPADEYYADDEARRRGKQRREVLRDAWRDWLSDRVGAVITVSNAAKSDLGDVFGVPASKVGVIPHGVDHRIFAPATGRAEPSRLVLQVAQYQPGKLLERAWTPFLQGGISGTHLLSIAVGSPTVVQGTTLRVIDRALSRRSLARLYRRALCLVHPSPYESFGLTLLEAMASGCPVIADDNVGTKETLGDVAMYIDGRSEGACRDAISRVASNPDLRHKMRMSGLVRAEKFNWQRSVRAHLAIFDGLGLRLP